MMMVIQFIKVLIFLWVLLMLLTAGVDTTLMVKGMGLVPEGQDENLIDETQEGIWEEDTYLVWR